MNRRKLMILLPILLLVIAAAGAAYMLTHAIHPERMPVDEEVVLVRIQNMHQGTEQVVIAAQGTVTAAKSVQVRPEVSGRVVKISDNLVPGGVFLSGEVLVEIDSRDYEVLLVKQKNALAGAELALKQELARQSVAEQEWQLLESSVPNTEENRDLALRIPQVKKAEAALEAALGAVAKAQLDLERCSVVAPFNSVVISERVDVGQVLSPQAELATLAGTDQYWVQVSVPVDQLIFIDVPISKGKKGSKARVIQEAGMVTIQREAQVVRLFGDLDQAGRLARLLLIVDDPLNQRVKNQSSELPLLLGSYVNVEIFGKTLSDVVAIPRQALHDEESMDTGVRECVWLMDADNRLVIKEVKVAWRTSNYVLVSNGFKDNEKLVISNIPTPIEGMKLRVVDS